MKKILLIALLALSANVSAQYYGLGYNPSFFGGGYVMDGQYVNHTQFKSMLLQDHEAYNAWNQGTSNLTAGYVLLYPSAAVLGWGIGTNLGNNIVYDYYGSYSGGSSGTVFIIGGAAGLLGAYYLIAKGQTQREEAIYLYNDKRTNTKVGLKPLINNNGGGFAITF